MQQICTNPLQDNMKSAYIVTSFYKFIELPDFEKLKAVMLHIMQTNCLLGTIILAKEGINGSVCGTCKNIDNFYKCMQEDARFSNIRFQETNSDTQPFAKTKVKLRDEIVTLGVEGIDPIKNGGEHLSPKEWQKLIADPLVLIIDTRNNYEVQLGTFKNAVDPNTDSFRDFPDYVSKNLVDKKHQKIAMFCTGGIRCEKSTAYLKKMGFDQVYQLEGGIINYLSQIPVSESLWDGECFVFDNRTAIDNSNTKQAS